MFSIKNWHSTWQNWSGRYVASPTNFYAPTSLAELQQIVTTHARERKTIRLTGAAHSFSPVAMPDYSALSLHYMRGLIDVDAANGTATFHAGTYLYEIGPLLAQHGLALSNMGDIDTQTLGGVISTGTHGTGVTLGSFSSMVTRWGFVNGFGEYVSHTRGDDDVSKALHVSLGILGVLVDVTIRVVPLYSLHYTSEKSDFNEELAQFHDTIRSNRHAEWFYFPGSERIQVKKMNIAPLTMQTTAQRKRQQFQLQLVENNAFSAICKLCAWQPKLSHSMSALSARFVSNDSRTDVSYHVFPTPRNVKFVETEYAIPLEAFSDCMRAVHDMFKKRQFHVNFPIECRTTCGEDGFLSPTQNRESAFIAFHMYKGGDEAAYFRAVHTLMQQFDGRAHWGKVNAYTYESLQMLYPQLDTFLHVCQQHDPHNIFLTPYFKQLFRC